MKHEQIRAAVGRSVVMLGCLLSVIGCGSGGGDDGSELTKVEREGEPDIVMVEDDDEAMTAAIAKARTTADEFIAALESPTAQQDSFAVKAEFEDGDHVEHMWLNPVRFADGKFEGRVGNEPNMVSTVKLGDVVTVAKVEISDWMYVDDGKLVGGFTLRVLRASMSDAEKADFDKHVPFTIEEDE